jgi:tetratricopeptide (TPR) repeat protein
MEPLSSNPPDPRYRLADRCLYLALATVTFLLGCQEMYDADVWWHLRAGRWILASGKVPKTDPFTFGSAGRPWIDLQWLFELGLAAVFAAWGVRGIVLMAATVCVLVLALAMTARDRDSPSWVVTACWLPALTVMSARFLPRPELVSLLGMALYLAVLQRADAEPKLAWLLPLVQILWVNSHALFVLGPFILGAYLIDHLVRTNWQRRPSPICDCTRPRAVRNGSVHVGGAALAACLACLANPYGLQGALLPLELFPKITAWGGMYKSYIYEFNDLQQYIQMQGMEVAARNLFVQADCFLLWILPVSVIMPGVWRLCAGANAPVAASPRAVGWLTALGAATVLVLTSAWELSGSGTPRWLVYCAEAAPFALFALGLAGAILALPASWSGASLAFVGALAEGAWIIWLRAYLFGTEPGIISWLIPADLSVLGKVTVLLTAITALLLVRAGERPFRLILAGAFGYLMLQAIRNANLFGLAGGFALSWSLGEWTGCLLARAPIQQHWHRSWVFAGVASRAVLLALVGLMVFMIVSGRFFASTGEQRQFGTQALPLAYAHEAARFAGRPGLPDHALVFSLTQAGVYLFHNGPDRKPFIDGRLEVPSRETFETYVRLNHLLRQGRPGWSDALRQMGDPLILLDHEGNYGAEATLLLDPQWRCVYYDAVASVFLSARRPDATTPFPSVNFMARHFQGQTPLSARSGKRSASEITALDRLALLLASRSSNRPEIVWPLTLSLRLLVCDQLRTELAVRPTNARSWCLLGDSWWELAADLMPVRAGPGDYWDATQGLLPAQAAYCYRQARELDSSEVGFRWELSQKFQSQRMNDARRSLTASTPQGRTADRGTNAVLPLLEQGHIQEAIARLPTEGGSQGTDIAWIASDRAASVLLYLGLPREARQVWEHCPRPPSSALLLVRIAAAELAELNYSSARRDFRAALEIDPHLGEAWVGLALLHTQCGEPAEVQVAAREGLREPLTPEQSSFLRRVNALAAPYTKQP